MTDAFDFASFSAAAWTLVADKGLDVLAALAILALGWTISRWARRAVTRALDAIDSVDPTLRPLIARIVRITVLVMTLIAALNQLGVPTTSVITVLGAAGLAIGLALQGTLSNIASGALLIGFRPFDVGDAVEIAGESLVVDEIGLFYTRGHTFDNVSIILPNNSISTARIKNFSRNPTRRIDLVIGIGYDDDLGHALQIVDEILASEPRVLEDPEPLVKVGRLGESSVDLFIRPWTATADAFATQLDLTRRIKECFDAEGITIPYPQRVVHVAEEAPDPASPRIRATSDPTGLA